MIWLQRVGHIPGKRAGMAGSEHHQCHQQRGWGTKMSSNLTSWLGEAKCSPVSSSILHFPQGPAGGARSHYVTGDGVHAQLHPDLMGGLP